MYEPNFVDAFVTTEIIMRNIPDRRKKVEENGRKVPYEQRAGKEPYSGPERRGMGKTTRQARGTGKDRRDDGKRVRCILRRPWDHLNMERAVKKHEFDLVPGDPAAGE